MNGALGASIAILLLSLPGRAFAQSATAEELYQKGVAEFQQGHYDAACQAFEASYKAEPLPGALFTLATCEMRAGRLASAASRYQQYLALVATLPTEQQAAQRERREVAENERKALLKTLPHLRIVATALLRSSAVIRLNGMALAPSQLGVELPVDAGEHVIEIAAADGSSSEVRVSLAPRERKSVVLSPVGVAAARIETTQAAPATQEPTPVEPSSPPPVAAYVALGVGLLGVGVGSVAGMRALDHKSVVEDECKGAACTPRGKEEADAGKTAALISTIGFGVGAVGLGAALALFVIDRGGSDRGQNRPRLVVSLTPRSVGLSGAF